MLTLPRPLVLASTSRYRQAQLARLGLSFVCVKPPYQELPVAGLDARQLVDHHAAQKALAVQRLPAHADAWIIAADQGVILDEAAGPRLLGKPGTAAAAVNQLLELSGRQHELRTALALAVPGQPLRTQVSRVLVQMRQLTRSDAEAYVALDQPLDCAGSYKIEAGGPWVLASCRGEDPTAIEGLPLLALVDLLHLALGR